MAAVFACRLCRDISASYLHFLSLQGPGSPVRKRFSCANDQYMISLHTQCALNVICRSPAVNMARSAMPAGGMCQPDLASTHTM